MNEANRAILCVCAAAVFCFFFILFVGRSCGRIMRRYEVHDFFPQLKKKLKITWQNIALARRRPSDEFD